MTQTNQNQNAAISQGEDKTLLITLTTTLDLTGVTARWVLQESATDATALIDKTAGAGSCVLDPIAKTVAVTLASSDTKNLATGVYYHACMLTDASGKHIKSEEGYLTINPTPAALLA